MCGSKPNTTPAHISHILCHCCNAGIDFGTARSGYAFAMGWNAAVQLQYKWPGEPVAQAKTMTALLYDKRTWQPIAWGMEAYKQWVAAAAAVVCGCGAAVVCAAVLLGAAC